MATLILHKEWKEFLACLNASSVEYLIVGAIAVAHHARPRLTNDMDMFGGIATNFIGRDELLLNKQTVARGRDLGDIEALRGHDPDDSVES